MINFIKNIGQNYKSVLMVYTVFVVGLFSQFLFFGDVLAPHRQTTELRADDINYGSRYQENRKFNDYSNAYIPEIAEALSGARSAWLTLWAPKNELGRPLYQLSGFTSAYFPSWIIAPLFDNPWKFISALSFLYSYFSGIFVILFFREMGLSPLSALIGGVGLGASPFFMYWLTFPVFPATWCWVAGILFGLIRIAKKVDMLGWLVLAFSVYSLGMTGYPQPIVYNLYIVFGYVVFLVYKQMEHSWAKLLRFVIICFSATLVGVALVLPVYADLAYIAVNSSRISPPPSFFSMYLPQVDGWGDVFGFIALSTFPEIFGNPISSNYAFGYDGLSVNIVLLFFSLIGLFGAFKKTWGWWVAVLAFILLTFSHDLYGFGVRFLGFNLSPSVPLGSILLPLVIIAAVGADELFGCKSAKSKRYIIIGVMLIVLFAFAISLAWGTIKGAALSWFVVALTLVILGLLFAQLDRHRPWLVILSLAIVIGGFSYPLILRQSVESIVTTSPLVEAVRAELSENGGRFAIVGSDLRVLPPNLNATLGLASIHSYNSLSSLRYKKLLDELGGDSIVYGRWNASISPNFNSSVFWMSNITLILAAQRLNEPSLDFLREVSGVYLHRVKSSIGNGVQVLSSSIKGGHGAFSVDNPRDKVIYSPVKRNDQGDLIDFDLSPVGSTSLLILSQKYHGDWRAKVLTENAWIAAEVVEVNGIFQGVLLPPQSRSIRLEFKPYVRFAWIGHVFWLAILALMAFRMWKIRHRILVL